MTSQEKLSAKQKLGYTLRKILQDNDQKKMPRSISSLRKLAASSGVEYAIIQKISTGEKDPQFTTLLALADGLNISIVEFMAYYFSISDDEVTGKNKVKQK